MLLVDGLFGDPGLVECIEGGMLAYMLHPGCDMLLAVIFTDFPLRFSCSIHTLREEPLSATCLQRAKRAVELRVL